MDRKILSMTVVRSPIYAYHDPFVVALDAGYVFMDQGVQHFSYTLLPHPGGWEGSGVVRCAAELNQLPIALIETGHPYGTLPERAAFVACEPQNVVVSAVKQAEDDDALILRWYETDGVQTQATIRLPQWDRVIDVQLGPCELKTYRVPRAPSGCCLGAQQACSWAGRWRCSLAGIRPASPSACCSAGSGLSGGRPRRRSA